MPWTSPPLPHAELLMSSSLPSVPTRGEWCTALVMKGRSNPESEDSHEKNVTNERESVSSPHYWVAAMNEKKALAEKCQTRLTMMKHSNPFAHANGRGDSGLNNGVGKDAQCGKEMRCYRRREK